MANKWRRAQISWERRGKERGWTGLGSVGRPQQRLESHLPNQFPLLPGHIIMVHFQESLVIRCAIWHNGTWMEAILGTYKLREQKNGCASFHSLSPLPAEYRGLWGLAMGRDRKWKEPGSLSECVGSSSPTKNTCPGLLYKWEDKQICWCETTTMLEFVCYISSNTIKTWHPILMPKL